MTGTVELTLKCSSHCIEKNIELDLKKIVFSSQQWGGLCVGTARHARARRLHRVFARRTRVDAVFHRYRRNNNYRVGQKTAHGIYGNNFVYSQLFFI